MKEKYPKKNRLQSPKHEKLVELIHKLFPNCEPIIDKKVPDSFVNYRPDIRCEKHKIIIEYDGDRHYFDVKMIINDKKKDKVYKKMGYSIIRIPYFIQISNDVLSFFFKKYLPKITIRKIDISDYDYPHGFISNDTLLPSSYSEMGIERFKNDLKRFSFIKKLIIESLKNKIESEGNIDLVLPKSLQYLIK